MKNFETAGFKTEVLPGILKGNAMRLSGMGRASRWNKPVIVWHGNGKKHCAHQSDTGL